MKTQISRDPFQPDKRYSGVYHQQGRMITDADWNALAEIVKRRLDEALADVVGSGAPRERGLRVVQGGPSPTSLSFDGNRLYAGGVPAQVAPADPTTAFAYDNQADFPAPPPLPEATAFSLYADVWERTVGSLEDADPWAADHLRDPALHGADTTTRTQTMAQVKWCPTFSPSEDPEASLPIGGSLLSVALRAGQAGRDPCDPCAAEVAVTQRVGNYLFRLEVHDVEGEPSTPNRVTLKWSSENGAEQHRVGTEPPEFKIGDYVYEFYNDETEKHLGIHLATGFSPARGQLFPTFPPTPPAGFDRVRRWDGFAPLSRSLEDAWSLLTILDGELGQDREVPLRTSPDGVATGDVRFATDEAVFHLRSLVLTLQPRGFVAGDYWLAPVRESIHKAGDTVLNGAPPLGIVHHYLRLADIGADGSVEVPTTDRDQLLSFPPLTDLQARDVDYDPACPEGLFKDTPQGPIDTVQRALDRLCTLAASDIAFGKPCDTSLYAGIPPADLATVADALRLLCDVRAEHVAYKAHPGCAVLSPNIKTVKDALDTLCGRPSGGGCRVTVGKGGEFPTLREAIERLLAEDKTDLCFCLLAGKHRLERPIIIADPRHTMHFTLCGCGMGSHLVLEETLGFNGVGAVRIADLQIRIEPTAQLFARGGAEVALEGIIVTGPARREDAPVILAATTSVRVAASRFRFPNLEGVRPVEDLFGRIDPQLAELARLFSAREDEEFEEKRTAVAEELTGLPLRKRDVLARSLTAELSSLAVAEPIRRSLERFVVVIRRRPRPDLLEMADSLRDLREVALRAVPALVLVLDPSSGDTTLVDNQIVGVVSVYGPPESGELTREQLGNLRRVFKERLIQLIPTAGRLSLARNEISRLVVGGRPLRRLQELAESQDPTGQLEGIFRAAYLAQNRFTAGGSRVLAQDARLTDNFFEPVDPDLGAALADTAIYVGNGSAEEERFLFRNLSRRHNDQTLRDLNTMVIV